MCVLCRDVLCRDVLCRDVLCRVCVRACVCVLMHVPKEAYVNCPGLA